MTVTLSNVAVLSVPLLWEVTNNPTVAPLVIVIVVVPTWVQVDPSADL